MKDSKTILTRHIVLSLLLQTVIVVLIALPQLEHLRSQAAQATRLPQSTLWIPLLALLVLANIVILRRVQTRLVYPVRELVNQTKLGSSSFAFKKKSMNSEEDHLKHFIESQCLKFEEMEQEVARAESEAQRVKELSAVSPEEIDALRQKLDAATREAQSRLSRLTEEQKRSGELERNIATLRHELKMQGRELENLQTTLKRQSDDNEPLHSILAEKLKSPLNLINNLSWRLARSWDDTPPSQIREGLEEICRQSEDQLELLKKYRSPDQNNREAL